MGFVICKISTYVLQNLTYQVQGRSCLTKNRLRTRALGWKHFSNRTPSLSAGTKSLNVPRAKLHPLLTLTQFSVQFNVNQYFLTSWRMSHEGANARIIFVFTNLHGGEDVHKIFRKLYTRTAKPTLPESGYHFFSFAAAQRAR
jgi:hypothetical protein